MLINLLWHLQTVQADPANLYQAYSWETPPSILICPDSTLTVEEIKQAIYYWNGETDTTFRYLRINHVSHCTFTTLNTIYITEKLPNNHPENKLAVTNVQSYHYEDDPTINYIDIAVIDFSSNYAHNRRVILHEMGHALGYKHSNHSIMKPYL